MSDTDELDFTSGVAAFEAKNFSQAMRYGVPYVNRDGALDGPYIH